MGAFDDDDLVEEGRTVRPYTVTGGRTRSRSTDLPLEALVRALSVEDARSTPERRRILELTDEQILSVAELSAHLRLPLGVVRVLVGDLAEENLVIVHGGRSDGPDQSAPPASNLKVLESVLNGISSL